MTLSADPTSTAPASSPAPPLPAGGGARTALTLGAFVAIGPLTIDMYLPALPAIREELATSASAVQLTLTGTLLGLAGGQLLIGPLSDALGRRRPLIAGAALHVLASLLILVAPTISALGLLRVLQGVGVAAAGVVAMAIVRDLFEGRTAAAMLSRLFLVMGVAPVLAPVIGAEVLRITSWRGTFVVLGVYGALLVVVAAVGLRETLPPERRHRGGVRTTLRTYGDLTRDRPFVGLVLVAGLTMGALFAYVAGSPFVYQRHFGLDEQQFGLLFGAGALWLVVATQVNSLLLRRWSPAQLLLAGTAVGVLGGSVLLGFAAAGAGGVLGIALPLWVVLFAVGLALPNAPALALAAYGGSAGSAAALLGAAQFGVGAAMSPVIGLLGNDPVAMAAVVLSSMVMALVVLVAVVQPWRSSEPAKRETA